MTPPGARLVDDPAELVALYRDPPGCHVYALADLDEPFWSASRWYRRGDAVVGLVSLPGDAGAAVYAVSTADPAGSLDLVVGLLDELPSGQLITGPEGLAKAVSARRPLTWSGPHLRHLLTDRAAVPPRHPDVVDLRPSDRDDVVELYATEPGAAFFLAHMLEDHTFVGVRRNGRLVAVAGTHVVSGTERVAALGAVYTHPDHRGAGLGAAVTAGVIHRLTGRADVIGLNVAEDNAAARAVYERLGFRSIWRYEECELA